MARLSSIQTVRECFAMGVLQTAVESIRDWSDKWGAHDRVHNPEEYAKTLRILGSLLELQADETAKSVREGEAKHIRESLNAIAEAEGVTLEQAA